MPAHLFLLNTGTPSGRNGIAVDSPSPVIVLSVLESGFSKAAALGRLVSADFFGVMISSLSDQFQKSHV